MVCRCCQAPGCCIAPALAPLFCWNLMSSLWHVRHNGRSSWLSYLMVEQNVQNTPKHLSHWRTHISQALCSQNAHGISSPCWWQTQQREDTVAGFKDGWLTSLPWFLWLFINTSNALSMQCRMERDIYFVRLPENQLVPNDDSSSEDLPLRLEGLTGRAVASFFVRVGHYRKCRRH